MPLLRFQPISPAAGWIDGTDFVDVRTRKPRDLSGVILTLGLYQRRGGWFRDYGRVLSTLGRGGWGQPIVTATTQPDGSGRLVVQPGNTFVQWTFAPGDLSCLRPGDAKLLIWAMVGGQADPVLRVTIPVLDGPDAIPAPTP